MTRETLVQLVCGAHGTIFAAAAFAFLNFSSYSTKFRNWHNDIEETLTNLKRTLAVSLGKVLKPILEHSGTTTRNILDSSGSFCETVVEPTEGEGYLNAISYFVDDNAHEMARYRSLLLTNKAYSFWATYLSWTTFILGILEVTALALIGYFEILNGNIISNLLIMISFSISAIGAILCFWGIAFLLINHNQGIKNRGRND